MDAWLAVCGIVAVATFTPGPNNVIVLEAAARGGLRAAAKPASAVLAGSLLLLTLAWSGAAVALEAAPHLVTLLRLAGCAWLAMLGTRLVAGALRGAGRAAEAPGALPRRWAAIGLFQLANPKAWGLMVTVTAAPVGRGAADFAALALVVGLLSAGGLASWAAAGSFLRDLGATGRRRFDCVCGTALVASALALATGAA